MVPYCFHRGLNYGIVCFEQQLVGLQDLYNSQKQLNADLSDKLEKTLASFSLSHTLAGISQIFSWKEINGSMNLLQKKLVETEHAFLDLEERYRQAKSTIKEKEFFISSLLKSGEINHVFFLGFCMWMIMRYFEFQYYHHALFVVCLSMMVMWHDVN